MAFKGKDAGSIKYGGDYEERVPTYVDELRESGKVLDLSKLKLKEQVRVRFIGPIYPLKRHWVPQKKNPNSFFPLFCTNFNPEKEEIDSSQHKWHCLGCAFASRPGNAYALNIINRDLQSEDEENPIQIVFMNGQQCKGLETVIDQKKKRLPTDPEKGYDMTFIAQRSERKKGKTDVILTMCLEDDAVAPLTKEERKLELIDLSKVAEAVIPNYKDTLISLFYQGSIDTFSRACKILEWAVGEGLIEENQKDQTLKALTTINAKYKDADEDMDDEEDDEDEEDEKSSRKRVKKVVDEEEDDSDEDEDEEEKPVKKKKAVELDEEEESDEEDEEEEEEDEEEEKPVKKKKVVVDDEDEDEEESDEEEELEDSDEEDEESKPKSRKSLIPAPPKRLPK